MAPRPPVEELTSQQAMQELARLAEAIAAANLAYHQADAPRISDADYDALKRRNAAIEAAFPELKRPDSPSEQVGAAPSGDLLQGPPRGPDAQPRERLRRGGRPRVRHPHPPLPEPARGRGPRLHRRAEDRRPLAVAALRGRPPRRRRHPRRRRDRRERHRERPHHPRHPRPARRRARGPRGPRRMLHEPRRLRGAERPPGARPAPAPSPTRATPPPARCASSTRASPPPARCTSSPTPGARSPSRWPTPSPPPSPASPPSASRPTR